MQNMESIFVIQKKDVLQAKVEALVFNLLLKKS